MITTVSLNPAIDKTILLPSLERGSVNRLSSAREDIGGKGINVAKILNRLHVQTQVCGFIGSQNKQNIEELISHEKLQYHFLNTDGLTRTNTKIVELDEGITTDLNEQGFYLNEEQMQKFKELLLKEAAHSEFVVFSGSIPRGLSGDTYKELISGVRELTKTVLDADGNLLVEGIKAGPYMMKPNIHELESAFEIKLNTDKDIISFCQTLTEKYGISLILVSMGEEGGLLISKEASYKAAPIKVKVKSTVGAGDSMTAGMLYGIEKGLPLADALAYATACGTLAVTKEGTQSFSLEEVREMLAKVYIEKIC